MKTHRRETGGQAAEGSLRSAVFGLLSAACTLPSVVCRLPSAVCSLLFLAFLAIYVRTAAPSVLSGDSAEFQFAAPLLGVPHPTTYPLYVVLGKLATLLIPFGDLARRVTLVSAICGALAVALFFMLAQRLTRSAGAAAVAALALGVAPGLWNAATLAEVYALLMLLLAALGYLLVTTDSRCGPVPREPCWRLRMAALVAGLGSTHHGLFVLTGLPLFLGAVAWMLLQPSTNHESNIHGILRLTPHASRNTARQLVLLVLCFAVGLTPWLYPLIQYARYGPFSGADYGLPRHYFWGAPQSWSEVFDLLAGGELRRGIFRLPSLAAAQAVLRLVGSRLWFEFGPLGGALGLVGCAALTRRARSVWIGTAWVFLATLAYLLLLGPAVADAPVFTLPLLLPWAIWIAVGVQALLATSTFFKRREGSEREEPRTENRRVGTHHSPLTTHHLMFRALILIFLLAATLAWGYTRVPYSSKRQLWLFRHFGEATLQRLPPGAVVITHWEQGTTLQYLILAEGRRPDVWVDIVEPGDAAWGDRARRYSGRPIFFVGSSSDVAELPVELVREDAYADLFQLR